MSRIPTPATIADAPAKSQPLLEAVHKQLGSVPNMFRLISTSPQALEGYLGLSGALGKGELPAATRERIALAVAEVNGCSYCLSAHTYSARTSPSLDDAEMSANRSGASNDPKADAAVRFAAKVAFAPRTCRGTGSGGRQARRIQRRANRRNRPARRPEHLDQLLQRGVQDRHRFPRRRSPHRRLSAAEAGRRCPGCRYSAGTQPTQMTGTRS